MTILYVKHDVADSVYLPLYKNSDGITANDFIDGSCHDWTIYNYRSCDFKEEIIWNNSEIEIKVVLLFWKMVLF